MGILTDTIPQADSLGVLIEAVKAVSNGKRSDKDIAEVLDYDERQGRYYRKASELIGLTYRSDKNISVLTPAGKSLLSSAPDNRNAILKRGIMSIPLFQRLIPYLESTLPGGCKREELETFIGSVTKTTQSMIERRVSTILAWLQYLDLITVDNSRIILRPASFGTEIIEYHSDFEPLLPPSYELKEYENAQNRATKNQESLSYVVDTAKQERANNMHGRLVNLTADKLRKIGAIPRQNRFIDLAARIEKAPFIFEIKTTTETNIQSQIRRGISQLYEYRYMQAVPEAQLVLLIETPLPKSLNWMLDYLVKDRGIYIVWDGNGDELYCPNSIKDKVSFLL